MANYRNKCFLSLILEARALKKKLQQYILEKEQAQSGIERNNLNKCSCSKIVGSYESDHVKGHYEANASLKRNHLIENFLNEDSAQNFILKSVLGFLSGMLLTYVCFMFLVFSLNFTLKRATYICMILGVVLSLGLAFSVKIRCTVFLCIPQLFSKRGRQALLAYAFILALSGPAKNTLHNVEVMSESLACGQEQIKQAENELNKCVQKPNAAAKKSVEILLEKINNAVKYFKNFILQFYRTCFDVLETLFHAKKWLHSIYSLCNEKMGNPNQRCENLLLESFENCEGADALIYWKRLCQMNPCAVKSICHSCHREICSTSDFHQHLTIERLQNQLNYFKRRALNILSVRVQVHQTYTQSNKSNTFHEEYQGMATEIRQKTDQFLQYFDFMSVIFGIFILVLFVKVIIYRHKFLTEDNYDNRFITPDFEDIDKTRAEFQMETILPLNSREKTMYIKVTSIRLVPCEKIRLLSSFVFLIFATFKIIIHMLTDSSLYWILSSVRRNEKMLYVSTLKEEEPGIIVRVAGNRFVACLLQNVTDAIRHQYSSTKLDPTPCLPDPVSPDWNRYYQIIALILICWLLALFEPYGLRLRHSVMVTYHPDRARERAIWLYNRIISKRNSFVKLSRRLIRRRYRNTVEESVFRFRFVRKKSSMKCLLCQVKVIVGDDHVRCKTENCAGIFCRECYSSLKYCSICTDPKEYGDLSDFSEEKDSSEDEKVCRCRRNEGTFSGKGKKETVKNYGFLLKKRLFEFDKVFDKECRSKNNLLQSDFLNMKYCRKKTSTSETARNKSDSESEKSKSNVSGKKGKIGENKNEKMCNGEMAERRTKSVEGSQKFSDDGITNRISPKIIEKSSNGLLFERSSRGAKSCRKNAGGSGGKKPTPDFLFRNVKKEEEDEEKEVSPLPRTYWKVKDSFEVIRIRYRLKGRENSIPARRTIDGGKETLEKQLNFRQISEEAETSEFSSAKFSRIRCVDEKRLFGSSSIRRREKLDDDSDESRGKIEIRENGEETNSSTEDDFPQTREIMKPRRGKNVYGLCHKGGRVRVCGKEMGNRPKKTYRICTREEMSSSEFDEQFSINADGHSSDSKTFGHDESNGRKKSVGMYVGKPSENMQSTEKFSSDSKPNRKGNSSREREGNCLKGKEKGEVSKAVSSFRLDDNFKRDRKEIEVKVVKEGKSERRRAIGRLSWAPDLLSDLPSSKKKGSGTLTDKE